MSKQVRKEQAVVDLVINGRTAETSIKGVQKAVFETEKLLRGMTKAANPEQYAKLRGELIKLKSASSELNAELRVQDGWWGKFKSNIGQIALGTVGGNVFAALGTAVASIFPKAIDKSYELSDAISDVKKTTGLAREEVDQLFDSFSDMKTRTVKKELQELAYQAGKLGEDTLEGVRGFVRGADVINVALKEDLGGNTEEAINQLGKLISIFDLKKEFGIEQSFIKVGSVINELGGKSAASEEYIVNFTTRLAGIAPAAKISIAEVMGLAAVMDEQGQSTELAATNIGKMLVSLGSDIPYFAKIAGMSVKDFTVLLNTNANEALLKVVERAKQSEGGLGNLAKTFKTLGIDGAEGAAVIGALANNIDRVREQQAIANAEFENGTSILAEYNEKNNNTAAIMDKIGRKLSGFWSWISKGVEPMARFFGDLLGVIDHNAEAVNSLQAEFGKLKGKEDALEPLIKKYNDLVKQAAQGRDVNKELKTVVEQIAKVMPAAVTEVDAYGRAIDISAVKVQNMLKYQRELYEMNKKSTLTKLNQEYATISREFGDAQKDYNKGVVVDDSFLGMLRRGPDGKLPRRAMSDKEREQQLKKLAEMEALQASLKQQIDMLNPTETAPEKPTKGTGGNVTGGGSSKADNKKEKDQFKELKEEIRKLQELAITDTAQASEKEVEVMRFKYKRLRELAKGNADYIKQLNELEDAELLRLRGEQAKEREEEMKKANEKYAEQLTEADKKAAEVAEKKSQVLADIADFTDSEQQKEINAIDKRFEKLIAQAEEVGLTTEQTLPLWEAYWQSREQLEEKYYQKSAEKANKQREEQIKQQQQLLSNVGDIFTGFLEIAAANETEYNEFRKISALVQIGVDTANAISSAVKTGSAAGITPIEKAIVITSNIALVLANMAKAKQMLSKTESVSAPNFKRLPGRESGGATDLLSLTLDNSGNPQGYINRPTLFNLGQRSWIGGEKFKQEYVFSNAMLQNPIFARFAAMAETLRTSGYDFSKNAELKGDTGAGSEMIQYFQILIAETRRNTDAVEKFSRKPYSLRKLEEQQELLDYARNNAKA